MEGLTQKQVQERIDRGEVNKFKDSSTKSIIDIFRTHFTNPSYVMTMIGVLMLLIYEQYSDVLFISSVILVNIVIGIVQEIIARNSLRRVTVINTEPVVVVRDGKDVEIMPEELVKDDVIRLQSGKYMYVDGKILEAEGLLVDESIVTGESDYIGKQKGEEVLSGSFIVSGNGLYKATKVGRDSLVNKITIEAKKYVNHLSPLQKYINKVVIIMVYITIASIGLLLILNTRFLNMSRVEITENSVAIISALVPQGILLSITIAFMVGVYRMYLKDVLVQKASGIEELANLDILCMDKTGTITKNKLTLADRVYLEGEGSDDKEFTDKLVRYFCQHSVEKNKTLMAIASAYEDLGKDGIKVTGNLPFNSKDKVSGVEIVVEGKKYRVVLGAIAIIKELLDDDRDEKKVEKLNEKYAEMGQRNLIFAYREVEKGDKKEWKKIEEDDFEPLLFVSIKDELREGAGEILKQFLERDVKPVIVSGDSKETIMAIVRQLDSDILNNPITGPELAKIENESDFEEAVLAHDIFASVTPEQKLHIVMVFQKFYRGVGMIGDGVNDALAIKQANLGISLGEGANVSRNISDIVLLDNDLSKLAQVIQEGKDIVYNTLRASKILTLKNFYSVIVVVGVLLLNVPFPFTPRNVFVLSFVNANFPSLSYLTDSGARYKGVNFMKNLLSFSILGGVVAGLFALGTIIYFDNLYSDEQLIKTITITILLMMGVVNYVVIAFDTFDFRKFNFNFKSFTIIPINIFAYGICFVIEPLRTFFEFEFISLRDMGILVAITFVYYVTFAASHRLLLMIKW